MSAEDATTTDAAAIKAADALIDHAGSDSGRAITAALVAIARTQHTANLIAVASAVDPAGYSCFPHLPLAARDDIYARLGWGDLL